ncbi:MAG TPA: hypothetical protein VFX49_13335 [Chloroflexota bacterium]|nr:hypothetical protein [Chloroflexota bacterium]
MRRVGWLPWALLGGAAVVSCAGVPPATALARLFFVVVMGGALVAGLAAAGPHWQLGAAGGLLALTALQGVIPRRVEDPPPSQWTVELRSPAERVRHTIALPLGSAEWERWWSRARSAAIFVCARGPLEEGDGLELTLGGERVARVTQAVAYGPRPQPTSVGFYRVPVTRAVLERAPRAVLELQRAPDASDRPIEICGTFTYKPTAGLEASAFFDGRSWSSPGPTQRGRYVIELRIEDPAGKPLVALY